MRGARGAAFGLVVLAALPGGAVAAPPEEAIMPAAEYKSAEARQLATAYAPQLRQLYDAVYHCRPWLDIRRHGIGFRTPRGAQGNERYLFIWVSVDQEINAKFAALPPARRASAMFSRHGVDLLRRLARLSRLDAESLLAGYAVVLSWQKPATGAKAGGESVAETLAVFADKATVHGFLAKKVSPATFAERALVTAFDGKNELGRLTLEILEDSFATTFRPKGYTPDPAHRC